MDRGGSAVDPFAGLKEATGEYHVYDSNYERIGKVDDLLVDEADRVLYVGIKMGLFGTNSTIVPVEALRVNDKRHLIEIMDTEENIKQAPHFGHRDELSPEFEDRVRFHFGLQPLYGTGGRSGSEDRYDTSGQDRFAPDPRVDLAPGERAASQGGAPLNEETARRDIYESGPYERERSPGTARPSLDIPLDDPAVEPRRETASRDVASDDPAGRPTVRRSSGPATPTRAGGGSVDRWEQLDPTGGGIKVHRKRR